jgi:hypothetical protein
MKSLLMIKFFILLTLGCSSLGCVGAQPSESVPAELQKKTQESPAVREAPPTDLSCPADDRLTLWEGRVLSFKQTDDRTEITVRADWDVTYSGIIQHRGTKKPPLELFRFKGENFKESDWKSLESEGTLSPDVRAKVWVCTDKNGKNPKIMRIDWLGKKTTPSRATP